MKLTHMLIVAGLMLAVIPLTAMATEVPSAAELTRWADLAVNTSCSRSRATGIGHLRAAGPAGLEALFATHAKAIEAHRLNPTADIPNWALISAALNEVGAQHDCHASRLYWHTDFEAAKAAAKAAGKPILSLRMLGNLTEECSCANSRFFRSTLYANEQVSKVLREQFVLHWKSVRPVPKVTIDFGDGRRLERTLTGNSIHYVLDAEGRPVEAIPGLYGPQAFLTQLEAGRTLVETLSRSSNRDATLIGAHSQRRAATLARWLGDLEKAGVAVAATNTGARTPNGSIFTGGQGEPAPRFPRAAKAAELAVGKGEVEARLIAGVTRPPFLAAAPSASTLEKATTDEIWRKIAAQHAGDAVLDSGSRLLIREHNPTAVQAARITESKALVENPLLRIVANLQNSIALDTVRNEYLFHARIHEWFAASEPVTRNVDELNKRIYAELFLTPDADPWLGLVDEGVYTGIRDGGLRR